MHLAFGHKVGEISEGDLVHQPEGKIMLAYMRRIGVGPQPDRE